MSDKQAKLPCYYSLFLPIYLDIRVNLGYDKGMGKEQIVSPITNKREPAYRQVSPLLDYKVRCSIYLI